jgi:uncharacterized membrane protein YfcA
MRWLAGFPRRYWPAWHLPCCRSGPCRSSLAVLAWFGRFGMVELGYGIRLIVPMMLGFAVSNQVVRHIEREHLRLLILCMSGGAALVLLLLQLI